MANDANDAPFTLHVVGEVTGKTWSGEFRAKKRLSHRDHLRKDQVRRELTGGAPGAVDERAYSTAHVLSNLAVRLTKWPEWWDSCGQGLDLEDDKVLRILHDKALEIEAEAAEAKKKAAEEAQAEMRKEAEQAEK